MDAKQKGRIRLSSVYTDVISVPIETDDPACRIYYERRIRATDWSGEALRFYGREFWTVDEINRALEIGRKRIKEIVKDLSPADAAGMSDE